MRYKSGVTRRQVLLSLAATATLRAQERLPSVYPGVVYRDYSRVLPDFLAGLADATYRRRNAALAQLTDAGSIERRQRWARDTFWKLIGGMPERTPLNIRTVGSFARPGYRVEKLVYETQPNLHVPANLYIPLSGTPPYPGVLFQMGHSPNGKAAATYQRCCQGLVQLGYVVLGFDPMGQGERAYYPEAKSNRGLSPVDEHSMAGKQMLLVGDSATRLQTWDAIRSLDVLAAHPLVDPKRIGATGQSGGGTTSMFLVAADDRIAASVICSGNTENVACRDFVPPGATDDAEQDFPGSGPLGWDRWDLLYPFAPKPLLVSVSDKDFIGTYSPTYISSGWEEFQKLKKVYEILGHSDRLAWGGTALPHGLSYDTRVLVYDWLERWLKGSDQGVAQEPATNPELDDMLWASPNGNVARAFGGETPHSLCVKKPVKRGTTPLPELLGVQPVKDARCTVLKRVPSGEADIEALEISSETGIALPAWLFVPKRAEVEKPLLILLEPAGRLARWHEGELYQTLAGQGFTVCVPDLRGVGDLRPAFGRGAAQIARAHNNEEEYAWSSLILGRPLLGQRVTDVLAVMHAVRRHPAAAGRRVVLAAQGKMTAPALYGALLDSEWSALYLTGGLVSFRSLIETVQYDYPFANFVPGVAGYMDLPEIVRAVAPRKVVLAGSVNAAGRGLGPTVERKIYEGEQHVTVRERAAWEPGAFRDL